MGREIRPSRETSRYLWDLLFIVGAPAVSFLLITLVSQPRQIGGHFLFDPHTPDWFIVFAAMMTHFHVMMVFVRSHFNKVIFARHPFRFIAIPILGLIAFSVSPIFAGIMVVVALYWDEWHTQMQTFGFARIFDARAGNNPQMGRKLDIVMIFVIGLFPHMILLTFLPEQERASGLITYLALSKDIVERYGHFLVILRYPLIIFALCFSFFYFYRYWQLIRSGYRIAPKKLALMGTTAVSTLFVATFYSLADGFYYFNIYHSLQYIYFVFFSETPHLANRFGSPTIKKEWMVFLTGLFIFLVVLVTAVAREINTIGFLVNFWLLSSLLHFWYDGFIWSVRRQEV